MSSMTDDATPAERSSRRQDAELLAAWRAGDRGAGERLFGRYVEPLLCFFRTKVGRDSEELVQRTFLACVRACDQVRDGSSFRAYLFRIARNELLRHVGRSLARAFDPLTASVVALGRSPSAELVRDERHASLLHALASLPLDLQIAIELHYWEEMPVAELADILEIPVGTVKTRLFRARTLLREHLAGASGPTSPEAFVDIEAWARSVREDVMADLCASRARRVQE
jgi:RNA polymerase sigma-70 factor (ECF subfamily)